MDDGGGEVDGGFEALVGLVGAHGDPLELFEFAEEVFDEMTPLVEVIVDLQRRSTSWVLGDDRLGAALGQFEDDGVAVEGFVGDQSAKAYAIDQRRNPDGVEALARQQDETDEIAKGIGCLLYTSPSPRD